MTTILAHIEIKSGKEENFYYCLLSFTDKWAFYHHQNSDHHEGHDFADVLKNISLEYLDPVEDASPLPHTEDPPLKDDMPDGMKKAQKRYPSQIASWRGNRK